MIQIKRGKTDSWRKNKVKLAAGQPGYDKDKHKIKIGDGERLWSELPDASGLSEEEIFSSEAEAKIRYALDRDCRTVITYGTDSPDKNTVGQLYLQYYDTAPEVDYVTDFGVNGIWTYQIWKSGLARCWGALPVTTPVQNPVGEGYLFNNETPLKKVSYPFTFDNQPAETATLQAAENKIVWLASIEANSTTNSGLYTILSFDKQTTATYYIALDVKGTIDLAAWKHE